jgi:citrate lyase subunit beta-like protein
MNTRFRIREMIKRFLTTYRRRCLFNVPGSDERKLLKIDSIKSDTIVLDLEDGVPIGKKQQARVNVANALKTNKRSTEFAVRINSVGSGLEHDDLMAVKDAKTIVIPKVDTPNHVHYVRNLMKDAKLIACIESAVALQRIDEIAKCDVEALVFASEDYCADTGIERSQDLTELLYARSRVVNAAKANDLQAIDLVCLDYKSQERLLWECEQGKRLGFTGKQAIHPSQVETIQQVFQPSEKQVEKALEIVKMFHLHDKKGVGAFDVDGKVVDMPVVKAATKVLIAAGFSQEQIKSL